MQAASRVPEPPVTAPFIPAVHSVSCSPCPVTASTSKTWLECQDLPWPPRRQLVSPAGRLPGCGTRIAPSGSRSHSAGLCRPLAGITAPSSHPGPSLPVELQTHPTSHPAGTLPTRLLILAWAWEGGSIYPHFPGEDAEAQRGEVTRPSSQSWPGSEPGSVRSWSSCSVGCSEARQPSRREASGYWHTFPTWKHASVFSAVRTAAPCVSQGPDRPATPRSIFSCS